MKRVGEPYLPDEITGRSVAEAPKTAESAPPVMSSPEFPAGQVKIVWRWYAWGSMRRDVPARWLATCWCDEDLQKAIKAREQPLYHTEFHADVPQQLVAEVTTLMANTVSVIRDGTLWVNEVPATFLERGLGYGSRFKLRGLTTFITRFQDALNAVVTICDTSQPDMPTEVLHLDTILTIVSNVLASADQSPQ